MAKKLTQSIINRAKPRETPYDVGGSGLILRVEPSGRKTYYVVTGRHRRTRIGTVDVVTLARAQYLARDLLNEASDFGDVLKRDLRKSTLGGFIESAYAPWVRANRRGAERTLKTLERNFKEPLYHKRLTDITRTDFDNYVTARREEDATAATVVRDLNSLRSVLRLAMERGYLRVNPFTGWRKPKVEDRGITRYLNADEEQDLRAALVERDDQIRRERVSANDWRRDRGYDLLSEFGEKDFPDHLTPMVLISMNSGLRFGELAALEWSAVDFRAKVLTVTGRTAKGAKTRHIPLNAEALDALTRWKQQGTGKGLVFQNGDGTRLGSVKSAWNALLKDAKIKDFRWHDLRHSFASKLVQRGVDLAVVRDLLGHGDFTLTLRYAHLEPKQKAEAVARLAA
jgi:site-specific recombinase XerD